MIKFLTRRIVNNKGAMDRVLVTLLLIIVGVSGLVGLSSWYDSQTDSLKTKAHNKVESAANE